MQRKKGKIREITEKLNIIYVAYIIISAFQ